ncbi:MAG: uridine diphosphate-N-acetylglucosamine-binding protein YvcK [Actinobacteria bacterium]|nr:uridine diphosphate-N-acetylglucosamine-binding protein YvcK [Actinomycetota bacterium]MCI0543882.1 uridine diphosphate-N-acetylglucosamine-binding protein YvcK [Actinomycetota bacterium]MCI0678499.1 uridine diphosphate-N-acetylglucosamine-binding protein YvcK [Actinomycetota bacterium]
MKTQTQTQLEPLLLDPEGPAVVAIGGGHGQAAALEAIQTYAGEIAALVTVADDGGSSGRLTPLGIPPPGDVRRCLLALTPEPSLWSELFAHRFQGADVAEHSLGNLILAALTDMFGDFASAVATAERMLGALGRVIPVADHPVTLRATIEDEVVVGQMAITRARGRITDLTIDPTDTMASRMALEAVAGADQVVIGPGSLYTSLISALKVQMLAPSVLDAKAQKVFVLNLVTQDGETLGMSGADHLHALQAMAGVVGPGVVVVHDGPLDVPEGHDRVSVDAENAVPYGWTVVAADVADRHAEWPAHDPILLGRVLEELTRA